VTERSISRAELMETLPEVLEQITNHGIVFLVSLGKVEESSGFISGLVTSAGEIMFAFGPREVLGRVFGLIDEEYGWPHLIQFSDVKEVSDLMPGYRRHPIICQGDHWLAMSISIGEYELLKGK
jgi:hypothetical protein